MAAFKAMQSRGSGDDLTPRAASETFLPLVCARERPLPFCLSSSRVVEAAYVWAAWVNGGGVRRRTRRRVRCGDVFPREGNDGIFAPPAIRAAAAL